MKKVGASYSLFNRYPTARKFFSGVFGVIVSTTVLWGHQRITKCWKYIKYISSVRLLLEEECPKSNHSQDCHRHETKTGSKRNACKKARRRRVGTKFTKDDSFIDEVKNENKPTFLKSRKMDLGTHDDESLVSEQSFEQIYDNHEKDAKSRLLIFADDSSEEQTIKTYTSSTSSNTVCDDRSSHISTQLSSARKIFGLHFRDKNQMVQKQKEEHQLIHPLHLVTFLLEVVHLLPRNP